MKKLIAILLLIALAGQTFDYVHTREPEVSHLQDADEKCEKNNDEKKAKDFTLWVYTICTSLSNCTRLDGYFCRCHRSPVMDLLQPPPDVRDYF